MITADKVKMLTEMGPKGLNALLGKKARGNEFTGAKFLGITNGGQFCYTVTFSVKGGTDSAKVYLSYSPEESRVIADMDLTVWA